MLPQLFHVGSFFLPTYGVLVALAFLLALWVAGRLALRDGLNQEAVFNLGIYCALAGIAGAKVLMILLDPAIRTSWSEILSLSTLQAAGIFYGGFIAALATAFLYMRYKSMPALRTADVLSPAVALGHSIGRLGCFAAGCCWGVETHLPWAVTFTNPQANRLVGVPLGVPLHPTQLYESLAEVVIFAFLWWRSVKPHRAGSILSLYLALYGVTRFLVEFVRFHDPQSNPYAGPFTTEQWISVALAALGAGIWWWARRNVAGEPVSAGRGA